MRQSFWALAFLVILAFVLPANAQDQQAKVELYVGYDYVRLNSGGNAFNFNGGSGQFTYNAQAPLMPDLAAQRAAMAKLNFLIGSWSGEARMFRSGSEPLELLQTESAEYKLDGLLLEINGIARTKSEGKVVLQALGIISYEDDRHTYRFRAFKDGRWLESDLKLAADEKGISWGFIIGEIRTTSTMRIAAKRDFNGAIALLAANAADYPNSASAQFGLGRAYSAAGDIENARIHFRKALEIDPSFRKASDRLNELR